MIAEVPPLYNNPNEKMDDHIDIARKHFEKKGYRVHCGLQFGCELVLYADDPDKVHSDFCVHVVGPGNRIDWRTLQTLVRSMPDLHKTLIVVNVRALNQTDPNLSPRFIVDDLAIASEHAPFRHKKASKDVGAQTKK
mmetsp:Transcript_22014/g.45849  ORF Transcript_22014/g.45849 Transcript_22014/m.45849 type:complete len:137 (-) Transcript_22014:910-1320(-)